MRVQGVLKRFQDFRSRRWTCRGGVCDPPARLRRNGWRRLRRGEPRPSIMRHSVVLSRSTAVILRAAEPITSGLPSGGWRSRRSSSPGHLIKQVTLTPLFSPTTSASEEWANESEQVASAWPWWVCGSERPSARRRCSINRQGGAFTYLSRRLRNLIPSRQPKLASD